MLTTVYFMYKLIIKKTIFRIFTLHYYNKKFNQTVPQLDSETKSRPCCECCSFRNGSLTCTNRVVPKQTPGPGGERNWHTKEYKTLKSCTALRQTESKWHGQLLWYVYLPITRTVPLGGSFQYSECRAWKVCLIRGCVKQCCCGTPPGAAESFTAVSQSLGLQFTTSGVNWRDKPSSIQALTPLRYYCSLSHATWDANWASASKKSHTQATLKQSSCSQSFEMMHGNKS